ncbi:MAG: hypothetical protein ISS82_03670 [Nanoarchaeota archaeon]|nr:hypothetical protein [Nanoarchaeota archaeon]
MRGYKEFFIKDLKLDTNKVAVLGVIVNKDDNNLVIDDNTGILQVDVENDFNVNDYVRVFGNLIKIDDKLVLKGDFIQDLNKINKELYKKVRDLL